MLESLISSVVMEQVVTVIDLAILNGTNGFRLDGIDANDNSGHSVSSAGDVNGDGFADLIIGARGGDPNDNNVAGESYVVFGKASGFTSVVDLDALDGADGFRLEGIDAGDNSGRAVSGGGDVNGDGFADLIIGADGAAPNGDSYAGESYVVFGKASGFTTNVDLGGLDGTDGFRLNGVDAADRSGNSVSGAGDVNGDGFADLIVGANGADPNGDSNAGESYVVFGKASGFTTNVDLGGLDGTDGFRLDGIDPADQTGNSVSRAGDVNGDGFADLIVGASFADPNEDSYAGESYVVFGKASGFTAGIDLGGLDGTDGFRLDGIDAFDQSSVSVSDAGDVNGDGFADLIIGALGASPNGARAAGESYVVFGKASGFVPGVDLGALDGTDGFRLDGIDAADSSGLSVSGAGDVNGDGFADLIVGAFGAAPNGVVIAGESYVVFGKASGFVPAVDLGGLDGTDGFRLDGIDTYDQSGSSVSSAGDVNGDGFADLIIGADRADPNGDSLAGESYVVFGFDSGVVTHQGTTAGETLTGDSAANVIIGGQGDDILVGTGGADVFRGGEGDDILDVADLGFQHVDGGAGLDMLKLSGAGLNLDFTAAGSQLVDSIEGIDLAGVGASVTLDKLSVLNLSEASNRLTILGGADDTLTLTDDTWAFLSATESTVTFQAGQAELLVDNTVALDVIDLVLTGAGTDDLLQGSIGDDILNGGGGKDTLSGDFGDDILNGGLGDDLLNGGDGVDTANYSGAGGVVIANLSNGRVSDGDGGSDTLTSIENLLGSTFNDVLVGNGSANMLTGGAGADRLDGRGGDDVMVGGSSNDIYTVSDVGDVVTELASEGTDRINTSVDFTNPDNVELLVGKFSSVGLNLTGNATRDQITGANKINSPDAIFGLGGNDLLVGLVGNDVINGGGGNDRIFGNSGADVITGALGNDRVTGQFGADTFVHGIGDGRDGITDFNVAEDLLDLTGHGFSNFAEVQALMTDIVGGALIDLAGSDSVLLQGIAFAAIGTEDVLI